MSIKSSYFVPTNTKFGVGQKFITINVGNKSYSFPIVYSQNNNANNVDFSQYFYNQNGVSHIVGSNVQIDAVNNGNIILNCSDIILNNSSINNANGLVKLNQEGKIPNNYLDIDLTNLPTDGVVKEYNRTIVSENKTLVNKQWAIVDANCTLTLPNSIVGSYIKISTIEDANNVVVLTVSDETIDGDANGLTVDLTYATVQLFGVQNGWKVIQIKANANNSNSSNIVANSYNSTITLPIPFDIQSDAVTLIVDFIPCQNDEQQLIFKTQYINDDNIQVGSDNPFGQQFSSMSSNSDSSWLQYDQNGYGRNFYRVSMANAQHRNHMKIYSNDRFVDITNSSVTVQNYGSNVVFTLSDQLIPNYIAGKTYFARYTWMDSAGNYMDWKGFKFSGDVIQMAQPQRNLQKTEQIYDIGDVEVTVEQQGEGLIFDYSNGKIQKMNLIGSVLIRCENAYNIPYGKTLTLFITNYQSYSFALKNQDEQTVEINYMKTLIQIINIGDQNVISYKRLV